MRISRNHALYATKHTKMLLFGQFWTIFDIMHFSREFKNENIPEITHLRYKIHRNATLRAVIDDFRHNACLLKNHKMKIYWNHQFCVEMWPKSLKYHTKSMLLAFCVFFMKTWFVISRNFLTILDLFCNRAQVRFHKAPCDFSKTQKRKNGIFMPKYTT